MIFRYSTLADAYECLKKYELKHVLKTVPNETSLDMEFGTAIHAGIKSHYEGNDASIGFFDHFNDVPKDLRKSRYSLEELQELGKNFMHRFTVKYAEKFVPIKFEKTISMPLEKSTYQGTLDMLCMYEGKVTLVDWKTSAYPYKIDKIYTNEQIYGYAALAEAEFGIQIEQIMYFVFVKSTGNIQSNIKIPLTREKLGSMISNIKMTIRDLEKRVEFPRNPNCKYCVCGQDRG